MPDSPPKRMTRARAKAVEMAKAPVKPTKITTAAAKATRTTNKRKTPADEIDAADAPKPSAQAAQAAQAVPEPTKRTRGRPKKAVEPALEVPAAAPGHDPETAEKPRPTRGRPKKPTVAAAPAEAEATKPVRAVTRMPTRALAAPSTRPAGPKKRVTFQDEQHDKENRVPSPEHRKPTAPPAAKATQKPAGIRAKPVRKPATTRTTRQGKKAVDGAEPAGGEKSAPKPLSPKKATQVATASSISSDDELSGVKTPIKPLSKSPVKGSAVRSAKKDVPTIDFSRPGGGDVAPARGHMASVLASPARKPPPSPFKNSLKETPRRINPGDSLFGHSAIKPGVSPFKSGLKAPGVPFGSSLLQSPARRPHTSPAASKPSGSLGELSWSSAFRASTSPKRSVKVHKLAAPEPVERIDASTPVKGRLRSASDGAAKPSRIPTPVKSAAASPAQVLVTPVAAHPVPAATIALEDPVPSTAADIGIDEETPERTPSSSSSLSERTMETLSKCSPLSARRRRNSPFFSTFNPMVPTKAMWSPTRQSSSEADQREVAVITAEPTAQVAEPARSTSPQAPPPTSAVGAFGLRSPAIEYPSDDSDSEDELQMAKPEYTPKPVGSQRVAFTDPFATLGTPTAVDLENEAKFALGRRAAQGSLLATATPTGESYFGVQQAQVVTMTPLAAQLENWKASSPEARGPQPTGLTSRGVFSPVPAMIAPEENGAVDLEASPTKTTFFEDEMSVRPSKDEDITTGQREDDMVGIIPTAPSEASQEYGDENALPIDPALLAADEEAKGVVATCTPTRIFAQVPRVIHTVSKVPLKSAAEESPFQRPAKRSNSLSGARSGRKAYQPSGLSRSNTVSSFSPERPVVAEGRPSQMLTQDYVTPTKPASTLQGTPGSVWSTLGTPAQTPRRFLNPETLKGAVVYVDVHTTEGADASGIFVELLTLMGARCVKQWTWNPDTPSVNPPEYGLGGSDEGICEVERADVTGGAGTPAAKIGITHVVYKDGGKRTLEKVRVSNGVVLCVGVGWVLDCEREGRWLDESKFAIDTSMVPRGGSRRRKSMEPRALTIVNGSLLPAADTPKENKPPALSPTKEFLIFSSPARRESTLFVPCASPETPERDVISSSAYPDGDTSPSPSSPATPYFLHPAKIVQRTCPPKQQASATEQQRRFFPVTGRIEDQPDEGVRARLMMARRKSLQWAPKIRSPLCRDVSDE
ncbi:MAG: hypothetical protein M1832_004181 [Thelocarpon impressellum]|nr:MAG: hypothetical protein M1832_004181 [Thelocarpon impressellum]